VDFFGSEHGIITKSKKHPDKRDDMLILLKLNSGGYVKMSEITAGIGHNINVYRKKSGLTLDALAAIVCKSKSTLSKYEKGEISIDIETLYELADAFHIHVEQLVHLQNHRPEIEMPGKRPNFFAGIEQFYSYLYDGRNRSILRSVFDVTAKVDENRYNIMMYMNYKDPAHYQNCETTYSGYIEHYDAITNIILTNQNSPIEQASAQILASYLDSDTKWGLWNGLSSRPMMPIATKMLFSKTPLKENDELRQSLTISKEDVRLLRLYNMFPVV
jgi:transcriptional regulator with XRE-family HTH domain